MKVAISRRDLLALAAVGGVGVVVGCRDRAGDRERTRAAPGAAPAPASPRSLDPAAWRALEALTDRILPAGAGIAGAREARVVAFIDAQLATRELASIRRAIALTAQLLDRHARERQGASLAELDAARQDEIVAALATGAIPLGTPFPQREAFRALHTLTLEGMFGDPAHGGNRDEVGWRSIGFSAPHLPAHDHERR